MNCMFHIVLIKPEIPQNTGNIGRLCVSNNIHLHLIEPLGFSLDDKYLKRAGMDYWQYLKVSLYSDWEDFLKRHPDACLYFFSTKGSKCFWECPYVDGGYLVFGNEGSGLPEGFYEKYRTQLFSIPMNGDFSRSLNLANATAIVLYEGLRRHYIAGSVKGTDYNYAGRY